jgi:hypothetical protein
MANARFNHQEGQTFPAAKARRAWRAGDGLAKAELLEKRRGLTPHSE